MRHRVVLAGTALVAGLAIIVWSAFKLMVAVAPLGGGCGGEAGGPECSPQAAWYAVAMFAGIGVCVGAGFAGRPTIVEAGFLLCFPAIGAGSLVAGIHLPPGQRDAAVAFGAIFLAVSALVPVIPAVAGIISVVIRWRRRASHGQSEQQ